MDNTILSLDELKSRITSYYTEKKAAAGGETSGAGDEPSEQDPQETTPPTPVKDDGDNADKLVVPDQALSVQNSDGQAENNIPGMEAGEASGKAPGTTETTDVTADKSKQKEDEAVTDPVTAKVAAEGLSLAERIKQRLMGSEKSASEEATEEATEEVAEEVAEEVTEEATEEVKESSAEEVASDFDMDANAYRKIASLVLGYQEGREMLDRLADRQMGKEAAQQLISEAEGLAQQEHAQNQETLQKQAYIQNLASQATEEDVKQMEKFASVHAKALSHFQHDFEKAAYDAGAEAAAAAMDEGDGMIPGDTGEEVSAEEIAEVIMAMVESGELDPQVAEALLAELAGAGGMPAGGGEEAAMMDPAMAEEGMVAEASYNKVVDDETKDELQKAANWVYGS